MSHPLGFFAGLRHPTSRRTWSSATQSWIEGREFVSLHHHLRMCCPWITSGSTQPCSHAAHPSWLLPHVPTPQLVPVAISMACLRVWSTSVPMGAISKTFSCSYLAQRVTLQSTCGQGRNLAWTGTKRAVRICKTWHCKWQLNMWLSFRSWGAQSLQFPPDPWGYIRNTAWNKAECWGRAKSGNH